MHMTSTLISLELFVPIGPSSPPTNFRITATSSENITVSWDPPPRESQNGMITAYTLTCQPQELETPLPVTYSAAGTYILSGFRPATSYNCTIFAATAGGNGPTTYQVVTLLADGKTFLLTSPH